MRLVLFVAKWLFIAIMTSFILAGICEGMELPFSVGTLVHLLGGGLVGWMCFKEIEEKFL